LPVTGTEIEAAASTIIVGIAITTAGIMTATTIITS
jgi:hypothetical protein